MFATTLQQQRGFGNDFRFPGENQNASNPAVPVAGNDDDDLYS